MSPSGRFVVLEGGEGTGKSTQARRLVARVRDFGRDALLMLLDLADYGIMQLIEKQRAIVGHLVRSK